MKKINRRNLFLMILGLAILLIIFLLIMLFENNHREQTVKIGFVMAGQKDENGWNGMQYQGIRKACEELGTELVVRENVKEFSGQCAVAVKKMAEEDVGMIMLDSYGYAEEMKDLVAYYPDIAFYVNSSE